MTMSQFRAECHITSARFFSNMHLGLGTLAALTAALAAGTAFNGNTTVAGVAGIFAAGITAIVTAMRPDETSQGHRHDAFIYNQIGQELYFSMVSPATRDDGETSDPPARTPRSTPPAEPAAREANAPPDSPAARFDAFLTRFSAAEEAAVPVSSWLQNRAARKVAHNNDWYAPPFERYPKWESARLSTPSLLGRLRASTRRRRHSYDD